MNDAEASVFDRIAGAIAESEDAEWNHLSDRPDLREVTEALERWAAEAFESTGALRARTSAGSLTLGGKTVRIDPEAWAFLMESPVAAGFIQLHLARLGLRRMEEAERRLPQLAEHLVAGDLQPRAEHYLHRVAQLYLWGFDGETYALARSVLEAALETKQPDEEVKQVLRVTRKHVTLHDRIVAARKSELLTDELAGVADDIRARGNDILHNAGKPGSRINTPLDAIRLLRDVLRTLYPTGPAAI